MGQILSPFDLTRNPGPMSNHPLSAPTAHMEHKLIADQGPTKCQSHDPLDIEIASMGGERRQDDDRLPLEHRPQPHRPVAIGFDQLFDQQ